MSSMARVPLPYVALSSSMSFPPHTESVALIKLRLAHEGDEGDALAQADKLLARSETEDFQQT